MDGNFFGVNLQKRPHIVLEGSGYTTDVEFSLKVWQADAGMIRFLGYSAQHAYRSPGGHGATAHTDEEAARRQRETDESLRNLAQSHPSLIRFVSKKSVSPKGMKYRFLQKGPSHLTLFGSYTLRGPPVRKGTRPMRPAERKRRSRTIKKGLAPRTRLVAAPNMKSSPVQAES